MRTKAKTSTDNSGEIPRWFVTYSDVITLLMTFFILLLTFASSEPEGFEMMQQTLFGEGGSHGAIGDKQDSLERDSFIVRTRPPAGRLTPRGSESPPIYSDSLVEAASKGLAALEDENDHSKFQIISMVASAALYFDDQGTLTPIAKQQLSLIANQMRRNPLELMISISDPSILSSVSQLAEELSTQHEIPPGQTGISLTSDQQISTGSIRLTFRQPVKSTWP